MWPFGKKKIELAPASALNRESEAILILYTLSDAITADQFYDRILKMESYLDESTFLNLTANWISVVVNDIKKYEPWLDSIFVSGKTPYIQKLHLFSESLAKLSPNTAERVRKAIDMNPAVKSALCYFFTEEVLILEGYEKLAAKGHQPDDSCVHSVFVQAIFSTPEIRDLISIPSTILTERLEKMCASYFSHYYNFLVCIHKDNYESAMKIVQPFSDKDLSSAMYYLKQHPEFGKKVREATQTQSTPISKPTVVSQVKNEVGPKLTKQELVQRALKKLNSLVGLSNVKKDVHKIIAILEMNEQRRQNGQPEHAIPLNTLLVGAPGTGKTTIAEILGELFFAFGLVDSPELVQAKKENLVAGYLGQTAIQTRDIFASAHRKILFIDEAYSLYEAEGNGFGEECINTLVGLMTAKEFDVIVFMAGYEGEMEKMMKNSNPGLKDRFQKSIIFENYSASELMTIFNNHAEKSHMKLSDDASTQLNTLFSKQLDGADETFSNARWVIKAYDSIISNQVMRLWQMGEKGKDMALSLIIEVEDIPSKI